jgi:hypothetical protein
LSLTIATIYKIGMSKELLFRTVFLEKCLLLEIEAKVSSRLEVDQCGVERLAECIYANFHPVPVLSYNANNKLGGSYFPELGADRLSSLCLPCLMFIEKCTIRNCHSKYYVS